MSNTDMSNTDELDVSNLIAVVGMAGRFPGAGNLHEFWQNLKGGVESISFFSDDELMARGVPRSLIDAPNYVKAGAVLEDSDMFDAAFFGLNPREAEVTDPQHRIFLECAWEALEDAGCDPHSYQGRIGVYAGMGLNTYLVNIYSHPELIDSVGTFRIVIGNDKDFLPTWVSYKLNLKGPSVAVQTACSTSLVATHLACQSLLNGECDMALAGGVSIKAQQKNGYAYQDGAINSPDGHCRAFDSRAQGTVGGNGVGIVVLKRLSDAIADKDAIEAVIIGSAINNDGSVKVGYTAPSINGQAEVIADAIAVAGVNPETITYVEAHGTATPLGDPIEVAALMQAFRAGTDAKNFCALGSVKTNIGHLDAAAGVAGLIKTVLALKHKLIPPSLNFARPNPKIEFNNSPFYVNATASEWKPTGLTRRAGVSSFGIGGTNSHVIVEEAPAAEPYESPMPEHLLILSAKTPSALESATTNLAEHLKQHPELELANVAYTLQVGRRAFPHRRTLATRSIKDAVNALETRDERYVFTGVQESNNRKPVFMFSGQGSQYVNMGLELYQVEERFRYSVDSCSEMLKPQLGLDLRSVLYPRADKIEEAANQLNQTYITQPALFVIEYALARLWMDWGVVPEAMIGHSIGEFVASCLAGVMTLEEALRLVALRGQMIQSLPAGAMLNVPLPEAEVQAIIGTKLCLAATNGPSRCVISGTYEDVSNLEQHLAQQGVASRRLQTSHAFHSKMMSPILDAFTEHVKKVRLNEPTIPYLSNVTGHWITAAETTDPSYWAKHLRQTARFAEGISELLKGGGRVLLEVGPGRTLSTLARQHPARRADQIVLNSLRHQNDKLSDWGVMLSSLGRLWTAGVEVNWPGLYSSGRPYRAHLPAYPFERKRFWIESNHKRSSNGNLQKNLATVNSYPANSQTIHKAEIEKETAVSEPRVASVIESARRNDILATLKTIVNDLTGIDIAAIDIRADFLEIGVDSLLLIQASQAIQEKLNVKISVVQLFEDLTSLDLLATYIDKQLPPDEPVALVVAQEPAPQVLMQQTITSHTVETIASTIPEPPPAPQVLPQPVIQQSVIQQIPVPAAHAPAKTNGGNNGTAHSVSGNAAERIMAQQLQLMAQQLDLLRNSPASPEVATVSDAVVSEATQPREPKPVVQTLSAPVASPSTSVLESSTHMSEPANKIATEPYVPYQPIEVGSLGGLPERQQKHLDKLIARYVKRTRESKRLTQAHRPHLADTRTSLGFRLALKEIVYPIVGQGSAGSKIWDVDGNQYVDISMGFGVHLFGHSPRFIMDALERQLKQGVELGPQSAVAGKVAEAMAELTGLERVTFCNSGTEAVIAAMRIARTISRRNKIAIFAGAYHGWSDSTLVRKLTVGGVTRNVPMAPGVPPSAVEDILLLDYDNPASLDILKSRMHELAAVMVEPVQSRRPDLQPSEFLHKLRQMTSESGTILIFDEMVTGFRVHPAGAQGWFGIKADIATYGKIIGGGLPIGVVAGKSKYMDAFDGGMWNFGDASYPQTEKTLFAGAFFKHPLTMAAALAVVNHFKEQGPALQQRLNQRTAYLADTLNTYFEANQVPIRIAHFGSLFRFVFARDVKMVDLFFYHLIEKGVFVWEGRNCFLSTAHTDEDIQYVISAVKEAVAEMQDGGFFPDGPSSPTGGPRSRTESSGNASGNGSTASGASNGSAAAQQRAVSPAISYEQQKRPAANNKMNFSFYYFGSYQSDFSTDKYNLLIEGAKFADRRGFSAVWVPERHFHAFGGLSPNAAVVAAAIARETSRIQIRAGSVVSPLHHPVRIAEEWAVVDNLSKGRVGISFASGWHPNDFVFAPDAYENRRKIMVEGIETVLKLWRGDTLMFRGGAGSDVSVKLYPMPMQKHLPVWLTCVSRETFVKAGEIGVGVLTNLQDQSIEELAEKIRLYRQALGQAGHYPDAGEVTVLLHTFLGNDVESVRQKAEKPFCEYLRTSFNLVRHWVKGSGRKIDFDKISQAEMDYILLSAYRDYAATRALIGTPDSAAPIIDKLLGVGVNEIGCLIDFGVEDNEAMEGFQYLDELKSRYDRPAVDKPVTHESNGSKAEGVVAIAAQKNEPYKVPLTDVQRQLWALATISDQASRAYNESQTLRMRGPFNAAAMRKALEKTIDRHDSLRTTFSPDGDYQLIHHRVIIDVPELDLSHLDKARREAEAEKFILDDAQRPFDIVNGPLIRAHIIKLEEQYYFLALTSHHIIADGQAYAVLLGDMSAFYEAECTNTSAGLPKAVQFRDYITRKKELKPRSDETSEAEKYWLAQYAAPLQGMDLPTDRPRPPVQTYNVGRHRESISSTLFDGLKRASAQHGCTLYMSILATLQVLAHQLTGNDDIIIGINTAEQASVGKNDLVGYRLNPVVLRMNVAPDHSFAEHVKSTRRKVLEAYEHQDYPISSLLKKLNLRRDPSRFPLTSVALNLDREGGGLKLFGLDVEVINNPAGARLDFYLNVVEKPDGLTWEADYNSDLFDAQTIRRWMDHFEKLLASFVTDPTRRISALPRLPGRAPAEDEEDSELYKQSNLSRYQLLIWMGQKLNPGAPLYNIAVSYTIPTGIDPKHFQKAFQAFVDRCDVMRTVIEEVNGVPRQRVKESLVYELAYMDFSQSSDAKAEAQRWMQQKCAVAFDIERIVFESALIKLSDEEYIWYVNQHHLITDGTSVALIFSYVADFYKLSIEGRLDEAREVPAYESFVSLERAAANSEQVRRARSYWREKLDEEIEPLSFYGNPALTETTRVERVVRELGIDRTRKLRQIAARKDNTDEAPERSVFNIFAAIVSAFMHRITGSNRISIGAPYHNRRTRDARLTTGLFIQIFPLRIEIEPGDTILSLSDKIAAEYVESLRHNDYSVGNPMQKRAYEIECNYITATFPPFQGARIKFDLVHPGHGTEILVIHAHDFTATGSLKIMFDMHCDVFDEQRRAQLVEHFLQIIDSFIEDSSQPVSYANLLTAKERQHLLCDLNSTEKAFPQDRNFIELFEAQVVKTPEQIAVTFDEQILTYRQLNDKADGLARRIQQMGVKSESLVALLTARNLDLLVSVLGVFKAGAAYIPLDPSYPSQRILQVLNRSKAALALAGNEFADELSRAVESDSQITCPIVERIESAFEPEPANEKFDYDCQPSNLAYVIYTSGSTGVPKGAMVEHKGMLNHLWAKVEDLRLSQTDCVAQTASQCFDISVWQMLAALLVGGEVRIISDEIIRDPVRLIDVIERKSITVFETVPSLLRAMLDEIESRSQARPAFPSLRWMIVTGEALPPELCHRWLSSYPQIPLLNAYGPTECSDDVTHCVIDNSASSDSDHTPIGRPIANMKMFILDRRMLPLPMGAAGELYVGGTGVGRGYLNDASRTAEVFVPDPFSQEAGARLYKTGDLTRYLGDGNIEFLGRVDNQVKIRGYRIELEEIEVVLSAHKNIRQAVMLAREDKPGEKHLVAYVVPEAGALITTSELRGYLKERLPDYMVPAGFVTIDALPLTPNGKVDRRALPAIDMSRAEIEGAYTAPRNRAEETLARIWSQVLGIESVGVHDNFFELGGDSILSIQIATRANQAGIRLAASQVFQHPTIAELSALAPASRTVTAQQNLVTGAVPLTPVQRWFFDLGLEEFDHWNQALLFEVRQALDPALLQESLSAILEHHDALRHRFLRTESGWQQVAQNVGEAIPFSVIDLSSLPESDVSKRVEKMAAGFQASLNISEGPLLRVALFDMGANKIGRLFIAIHHLAVDGVSWRILLEDLQTAYEQLKRGETVKLPTKTTSFKYWAERLQRYARSSELSAEREYWLAERRRNVTRLPLDYPEGANTMASAQSISMLLSVEETQSLLRDVPEAFHTQINDVLLTALAQAFEKWTGAGSVLVDLEGHGREELFDDVDLSRTVGWFTTIFPVLLEVGDAQTPADALRSVKEQLRGLSNRGISYGLLRYMSSEPEVSEQMRALPQAEVAFNYLGQLDQVVPEQGPLARAREGTGPATSRRVNRSRLLEVNGFVIEGRLRVDWAYSKNLHDSSTIERLADNYREALCRIITASQSQGPAASKLNEFNWAAGDLDNIAAALSKSKSKS